MKVDFVNVDDWEGMYIDGRLVQQGHSLEPEDVLRQLNIEHDTFWVKDDNDLSQWDFRLPENFSELDGHLG